METFLISIACTAVVGLAALVFQQPKLYDKLFSWLAGASAVVLGVLTTASVSISIGANAALSKWPGGEALNLQLDSKVPAAIGNFSSLARKEVDLVQQHVLIALFIAGGFMIYVGVLSFLSQMVKQHKAEEDRNNRRDGQRGP